MGPQIRTMLASEELEEQLSDLERNAWQAFRMIVEEFLGNHRRDDYAMVVSNLIESYEKFGCRKLHFLHSHLDIFRDNLGNVKEEYRKKVSSKHPDDGKALSREVERSHDGRLCMKFDYLMRKCNATYKQKSYSKVHF